MTPRNRRILIVALIGVLVAVLAVLLVVRSMRVDPDVVELVRATARRAGVDPDLAEALMRVESKGDPRARSPVGARGLLQLMPPTAREIAEREGIDYDGEDDLDDPALNARLGILYLREMLRRFRDERLALAAYNAGQGRVQGWMNANPHLGPDELIGAVAFAETRHHVAKVLRMRDELRNR
jgi:soluble lytic murein transglycosylase